jgi:hypothetical protein
VKSSLKEHLGKRRSAGGFRTHKIGARGEITVEIKRRYDAIVVEYNRGRCAL